MPYRFLRIAGLSLALLGVIACGGESGQSMECRRYVSCVAKLTGTSAAVDGMYGVEGTCWMDGTQSTTCTKNCKSALAAFPADAGC